LIDLAKKAHTVILYRASANQKALLVKLVRDDLKDGRILAIGDGPNDANMLT